MMKRLTTVSFGLLVTSTLGFKARVGSALFELCGGVRDIRSLRFNSQKLMCGFYLETPRA